MVTLSARSTFLEQAGQEAADEALEVKQQLADANTQLEAGKERAAALSARLSSLEGQCRDANQAQNDLR